VTIVAPPGYGKTTVLGQWAERDPREFAWLSLDRHDNDPVVFLTYVAEMLNRDGSVQPTVFKALTETGGGALSSGLPKIGAALASRRDPIVLVLDDVHMLEDPRCLDALAILALHVPESSQLVLSGRAEPQIGVAKMRANRQLLQIDAKNLALNDREAQALLIAAGAELTVEEAAQLNAHAEGWPAGLYLAALALADGTSLESFGGDDRFVADYLRSEELSRATPEETEFLLSSAVLERMSGAYCDAVLERSDSSAMLARLEQDNLFVIPLDHRRAWFRYHHLFREMLRAELERREPAVVPELNRRAAAWCEANGRVEEAVEHLQAADDMAGLARVVAANVYPYYRTGRVRTVERWLAAFDDPEVLRRFPAVAAFGAWVHALRGRPEPAERWAVAVDQAKPESETTEGTPIAAQAASARAALCRRGIEDMLADARIAVDGTAAGSLWRPPSLLLLGIATLLGGDPESAETVFAEAADTATAGGTVWTGAAAHSELALLALERGDVTVAQAEVTLAREFVGGTPTLDYVFSAIVLAASARVHLARSRGSAARQALAVAQRQRPLLTHALPWLSVQARVELAKAYLDLHDPRGAATLLHEADDVLRRRPRLGTLAAEVETIRARITETADESSGWASTLTAAELRLLPLLTTHLSFREIGERLFVSRNTVKTQAIAVYRKLGASSRSEAIERGVALGLVDAAPGSRSDVFTRSG